MRGQLSLDSLGRMTPTCRVRRAPPHGLLTQVEDDPHLPGAAGAQHLGLYAGVVAGGFHSGLDACPLVGTEVAAVEVAAHRRLGYTGILGKFGDVHEMPPHFSALQGSFGIDLTRGVCYNTALCMTISGKKGKPR